MMLIFIPRVEKKLKNPISFKKLLKELVSYFLNCAMIMLHPLLPIKKCKVILRFGWSLGLATNLRHQCFVFWTPNG